MKYIFSRVLIQLVLIIWGANHTSAQSNNFLFNDNNEGNSRIFYGGIAAGINASQIDGDTYTGYHKAGLNIGLSSIIRFNNFIYGNIELLYTQKGARNYFNYESPQIGTIPILYIAQLHYIEIPVNVQILVQERILIGLGASYNRLFNQKEYMENYYPNNINNKPPNFKQQDIELNIGASYLLYKNILARARYQYSLQSIRDAIQIPSNFNTIAQYNNLFALQFLIYF